MQALVSKDLYVLRRAAEIYQGLIDRFAPQQRTDYVALLNEWAVGFYTELDFKNEAANMAKMREVPSWRERHDCSASFHGHDLVHGFVQP